ncbi:nucleoside hydrolase [Isoptericola sp. b490]|uniref:nucleoside hydrolase n=1 Tax=Actinotalea lenta TaxID=3064654 RepID=UPI0027138A1E|nr:nucleoside hydrolase [Isoptericola sp. b490]MDO8121526.1 nucleoside hydrolase [Isoptericola sp. b490]
MIIDTDTASDDAVALVLALTDPRAQVLAVTVVSGNVPLTPAVQNALYTVELCGADVPVHAGADRPLQRPAQYATDVHGQDGMGDIGLVLHGREPRPEHAVDVLIDLVRRNPGEITLVTLGPLTNIALALRKAPDIAALIPRVVMMAGAADGLGNVTPAAEFNVWVDPEAADIVYRSGMPLVQVGWDVSRKDATLTLAEGDELAARGPLGEFCVRIQRQLVEFCREVTHIDGFDLPDPVTMAVALEPAVATRVERRYVVVETSGDHTTGATLVDHLGVTGEPPNVDVVLAADRARFREMLLQAGAARAGR